VSTSADERVRRAVKESQQVVNDFFWRVYAALSVLFVLLIICLGTAFVLMRRLFRRVASNTAVLRSEDGRIADLEADPGTSAAGAGRKEGHP
jgi:flagellar biosynthesis/type III secretory pathway M-ring protein FliF/YscJ